MDPHYLDLGVFRFTEFGVILMLPGKVNLNHLQSAAFQLLEAWPILQKRVDLRRGIFVGEESNTHGHYPIFQQAKTWPYAVRDIFPSTNDQSGDLTPSMDIQTLFHSPTTLREFLYPPVLSLQAIQLLDACLLSFCIQHPLCDAYGLQQIVQSFCTFLCGGSVDALPPRYPLLLKDEVVSIGTNDENSSSPISPTKIADLQIKTSPVGWWPLIKAGVKLSFSRSQQVERSYLIPLSVLNKIRTQALQQGHGITLNDVLMALIWKASTVAGTWSRNRSNQAQYPPFSFVLNIQKQMQHDNLLHNPVLAITAPSPKVDLEHGASDFRIHTIISLAVHLRSIITNARSMNCLRPITEHHRNARGAPLILRTNFFVTSWSHIPLRTTKFQMQNNEKIQAIYTHPFLRMTGLFRKLGIQLENSLITSNDRNGGFWVHGKAERSVWEELADLAGIKK